MGQPKSRGGGGGQFYTPPLSLSVSPPDSLARIHGLTPVWHWTTLRFAILLRMGLQRSACHNIMNLRTIVHEPRITGCPCRQVFFLESGNRTKMRVAVQLNPQFRLPI